MWFSEGVTFILRGVSLSALMRVLKCDVARCVQLEGEQGELGGATPDSEQRRHSADREFSLSGSGASLSEQ